ncbi:YkgJ family cysteine cluster protein [Candidatus Uabimicrobium sp. HlEnr_7]|uniref:YkgJ family cysteine cluster protein n=1 Tax=Candidatus Uabimicrobium helgolandensis TaxID=3095367 RepID=UPI003558AC43
MEEKINKLTAIYEKIENQVDNLKKKTCVSCIVNCGECCKRFEPYISVLEAVPLAKYLRNHPEKHKLYKRNVEQNKVKWNACPFYDNETHCTVYDIRPLICRLFGFSANRNRQQKIIFATCTKIEQEMPEKVKVARILTAKGLDVPIYQDIAQEIQDIDFVMATDYHPFSKSVKIAMDNYDSIMQDNFQKTENSAHSFSDLLRRKIRTGEFL